MTRFKKERFEMSRSKMVQISKAISQKQKEIQKYKRYMAIDENKIPSFKAKIDAKVDEIVELFKNSHEYQDDYPEIAEKIREAMSEILPLKASSSFQSR